MGVVGLPSAVTGLAAISIMAEMTFMPGRQWSSKFSHVAGASGLAWRLISNLTVFAMVLFRGVSLPSRGSSISFISRRRSGAVVGLMYCVSTSSNSKRGPSACAGEAGLGGLQEFLVVALREVGLVVRAARFVAEECALDDDARELEHVVELTGEGEAGVGPLALVSSG